jgi:MFS family permease
MACGVLRGMLALPTRDRAEHFVSESHEHPAAADALRGLGELAPGTFPLAAAVFAVFFAGAVTPPTLEAMVRTPYADVPRATQTFMLAGSLAHILGPLAGLWSDRIGRRLPLIGAGLAGSGIATALLPWATSFHALLGLRFLEGVFSMFAATLVFARAADIAQLCRRGRTMAAVTAAMPVAYLLAPLFVEAAVRAAFSLKPIYAAAGAVNVAAGALVLATMRGGEVLRRGETVAETFAFLLRTPRLLLPMVFGFADKVAFASIALLTSAAIKDIHGIAEATGSSARAMAAFWIGFVVAALPAGLWCDRKGIAWPLLGGSAAFAAVFAALPHLSLGGFYAGMGVLGALSAVMFLPSFLLVPRMSGAQHRGLGMGAFNGAGTVGLLCGFAIAGILLEKRRIADAYLVGAAMQAGAVLVGLACLRMIAPREAAGRAGE